MEDIIGIIFGSMIAIVIVIGMPWLILHYMTKWKQAPKITEQDERLLDEMHQLSRRLEDRLQTVERIIAADNPDYRPRFAATERTEDYRPGTRDPYRTERSN